LAHSLCDETSGALQSGRWTRTMANTSTLGHLCLISALGWVVAEPSMWAVRCLGETQLACWSAISRVAVQRHGASAPTARNVVPHMTSKTARDAEGSRSDCTFRLATHDIASSPWAHRAPSSTRSSTRNPLASKQASRFLLQSRTHPDQGPSPFPWGRKNYARLFPGLHRTICPSSAARQTQTLDLLLGRGDMQLFGNNQATFAPRFFDSGAPAYPLSHQPPEAKGRCLSLIRQGIVSILQHYLRVLPEGNPRRATGSPSTTCRRRLHLQRSQYRTVAPGLPIRHEAVRRDHKTPYRRRDVDSCREDRGS